MLNSAIFDVASAYGVTEQDGNPAKAESCRPFQCKPLQMELRCEWFRTFNNKGRP